MVKHRLRGDEDMPNKKKCPIAVRVTYDTVSPESSEHDSGWIVKSFGEWSTHGGGADDNWHEGRRRATHCFTSPRNAAKYIHEMVGAIDSGSDGLSYYSADAKQDYQTGDSTSYAAHVARVPNRTVLDRIYCNVIEGDSSYKREFDKHCSRRKF